LQTAALEILDSVRRIIRQDLLDLIADWIAQDAHAVVLVPEGEKTIAHAVARLREVADVLLADERLLGGNFDFLRLDVCGADPPAQDSVALRLQLRPVFQSRTLEVLDGMQFAIGERLLQLGADRQTEHPRAVVRAIIIAKRRDDLR